MSADYYDNEYGSGGYGDMRHGYEQAKANSINTLASLGSVEKKDGKHYWLGMEVPEDIAPSLEHFTSGLPAFIANKLNNKVYENALQVYDNISKALHKDFNRGSAHKFALSSAAMATTLLIGTQPAMAVVQSVKESKKERTQIRNNLKTVIEADKLYKDNEIVKTALERVSKVLSVGLKDASSQLPTVLVNSYFGFKNHKLLKENATLAFNDGRSFDSANLNSFDLDDSTQKFVGGGAVIGNALLKRNVSKSAYKDLSKPNAYSMIMELKRNIDAGYGDRSEIAGQVMQIFQQNEIDRGRIAFGDKLTPKLEPLAQRIGEVVASGELDPISLVNLVGNGSVIKKDASGNRRFINTEQLETVIDDQRKNFGNREKTSLEELLSNFQNPKIVMQAIKDNLKNLQGDEKAIFASMFSDDVLQKSGVKDKELAELRSRGCDVTCEFIKSIATELAQKSPEELKAKGLSEKEIEAVSSFKELADSGDKKSIESAIRSTDGTGANQIKSAVVSYGFNEKNPNFSWSTAIKNSRKNTVKSEPAVSMVEAVKSKQNDTGASLHV